MPLISLSPDQLAALGNRIHDGWNIAKSTHVERMERARQAYRRFCNLVDTPAVGEEVASNVRVPLVQWQVFAELAREGMGLFGDDAETIAKPTGPADQRIVTKVARFMDWRVFDSMKLVTPALEMICRKVIYGRSFALLTWESDEYEMLDDDGNRSRSLWYEGPKFLPLWPDDLIVPNERVRSVQDFSWVIVRDRVTWDQLVRDEARGMYSEVRRNLERIKGQAVSGGHRAIDGDEVRDEADSAEGVDYASTGASDGTLERWRWYGSSEPDDDGRRDDLLVNYLPDLNLTIGVQDLMEIYPMSRYRRPLVESALLPTGDYWCPGYAKLLEMCEDELTTNENLFTEAAEFASCPIPILRPAVAAQVRKAKIEPRTIIESDDPASARFLTTQVNAQAYTIKQQSTLAIAERITGLSDQAMGRAIDRPNAPRTATGQTILQQQGDVRLNLNLMVLREDWGKILGRIWELECQFNDGDVFFRVAEEDAGGLFDVNQGGAMMRGDEFAGRYDFDIKFATSHWDRMARKQDAMTLFQAAMGNPIVAQNPRALWKVTADLYQAFGRDNFSDLVPEPPDPGTPKDPKQEWAMAQQGERIAVCPLDNDDLHLMDHQKRLDQASERKARNELVDMDAVKRMITHTVEHRQQKRQKMMLQALTQQLLRQVKQTQQQSGPMPGGIPEFSEPGSTPALEEQPQPQSEGVMQ